MKRVLCAGHKSPSNRTMQLLCLWDAVFHFTTFWNCFVGLIWGTLRRGSITNNILWGLGTFRRVEMLKAKHQLFLLTETPSKMYANRTSIKAVTGFLSNFSMQSLLESDQISRQISFDKNTTFSASVSLSRFCGSHLFKCFLSGSIKTKTCYRLVQKKRSLKLDNDLPRLS